MKILSKRERIECCSYSHNFDYVGKAPGHGFAFRCDANGVIDLASMADAGRANYAKCLDGTYKVHDMGVVKSTWHYMQPAIGECEVCGEGVALHGFTNTCDVCNTDYNMSGARLAPREQWGEETGETAADILLWEAQSDGECPPDCY